MKHIFLLNIIFSISACSAYVQNQLHMKSNSSSHNKKIVKFFNIDNDNNDEKNNSFKKSKQIKKSSICLLTQKTMLTYDELEILVENFYKRCLTKCMEHKGSTIASLIESKIIKDENEILSKLLILKLTDLEAFRQLRINEKYTDFATILQQLEKTIDIDEEFEYKDFISKKKHTPNIYIQNDTYSSCGNIFKDLKTITIPIPHEDKFKEIKSAPKKLIIGNNNNNLNRNRNGYKKNKIYCKFNTNSHRYPQNENNLENDDFELKSSDNECTFNNLTPTKVINTSNVFGKFSNSKLLLRVSTIFLMGSGRCGKTSIKHVVFHKMEPYMTPHLLSTLELKVNDCTVMNNELVKLRVIDFPGYFDFDDSEFESTDLFKHCSILLFVIDAQDPPYKEALNYILRTMVTSNKINKYIKYKILINKLDSESFFTSESKVMIRRVIEQEIISYLCNIGLYENMSKDISFYLTSIYDYSILKPLSEIVQESLPALISNFLKNLLNSFVTKCNIEKAFIFDVVNRLQIASDDNIIDEEVYSLCLDMIDLTIDVLGIYEKKETINNDEKSQANDNLVNINNIFDGELCSFIKLQNEDIFILRQIRGSLALVCIMKENKNKNKGLFEYNIKCFKDSMNKLFELFIPNGDCKLKSV